MASFLTNLNNLNPFEAVDRLRETNFKWIKLNNLAVKGLMELVKPSRQDFVLICLSTPGRLARHWADIKTLLVWMWDYCMLILYSYPVLFIMIDLFLHPQPVGITLYWMTSNLICPHTQETLAQCFSASQTVGQRIKQHWVDILCLMWCRLIAILCESVWEMKKLIAMCQL